MDRSTNTLSAVMKRKGDPVRETEEGELNASVEEEEMMEGIEPFEMEQIPKSAERNKARGRPSGKSPGPKRARLDLEKQNSEMMMEIMRELKSVKEQLKSKWIDSNKNDKSTSPVVKSPSDTVIYAPAVKKRGDGQVDNVVDDKLNGVAAGSLGESFENELNKYLSLVRLGARNEEKKTEESVKRKLNFEGEEDLSGPGVSNQEVRELARDKIVEAEKYKMALEPPKGLEFPDFPLLDDDEFMHVSCAVEDSIAEKAYTGKFLEMDKLLVKYLKWQHNPGDSDKLELVNRGGVAEFRVSEDRPVKITNVHMWEKAFRIYMALYTKAHPLKAHEMVQYIHTINHAASKYVWENVAYYDVVFRQMMAKNPNRSWGKIYTQMWNMAMCDPLKSGGNSFQTAGMQGGTKKGAKGICWKFNRGICNYPHCRYAHKCTFCGGTNHGAHVCFKKEKRNGNKNNSNNGEGINKGSKRKDTHNAGSEQSSN